MNYNAKTIVFVECDGKAGECEVLHQAYYQLQKHHLDEKVRGLISFAFRDAVNNGWFVDPKTSDTFCPDCAENLHEKSKVLAKYKPEPEAVTLN